MAGELADGFADGPATTLPPPNGAIGSNDAVGDGIDDWLQSGAAEEAGSADQAIVADEAAAAGVDGIIAAGELAGLLAGLPWELAAGAAAAAAARRH